MLEALGVSLNKAMVKTKVARERNLKEDAWKDKFERLVNYKRLKGSTRVPKSYSEDTELATWVYNQRKRYKEGKLMEHRVELLNNLGFEWSVNKHSAS